MRPTRRAAIKQNGEVIPMLFEGQTIKLDVQDGGIAELRRALDAIAAVPAIRGVLITSAKDNSMREMFRSGWDIRQF